MDDIKLIEIWNKVLKAALNLPGAKVDRDEYLKKELSKRCTSEQVEIAINTKPSKAKIPKETIQIICKSAIKWHSYKASGISFGLGLPGGWAVAGTIPVDLAQFYWHIIVIIQKLAYLNGWSEFIDDEDFDDETLLQISLFIGIMTGAEGAASAVEKLAQGFAAQVAKELPKKPLTKYGIYNVAKQIGKWVGLKVTKDTFSKGIARAIPIVSGFISGGITLGSMRKMSKKLRLHLSTLELAN